MTSEIPKPHETDPQQLDAPVPSAAPEHAMPTYAPLRPMSKEDRAALGDNVPLEPVVMLGYGDVVNISFENDENGRPIWDTSAHEFETDMLALYVCENQAPRQEPWHSAHAGQLKLRENPDGTCARDVSCRNSAGFDG
jgi:hypothetical protein